MSLAFYTALTIGTLVPGMPSSTTVPEYVEIFDKAITLSRLPSPPLDTSKMTDLESLFYERLVKLAGNKEFVSILQDKKDQYGGMHKEAMEAMMARSMVRSPKLSSYQDVLASNHRVELMEYEAKMVELLQNAVMGGKLTLEWKELRSLMVAAQRDFKSEGHHIVVYMAWAAIGFSILAIGTLIYFTRMKSEEATTIVSAEKGNDFV